MPLPLGRAQSVPPEEEEKFGKIKSKNKKRASTPKSGSGKGMKKERKNSKDASEDFPVHNVAGMSLDKIMEGTHKIYKHKKQKSKTY